VVRWKLLAYVGVIVALGGLSARSISQSTARTTQRTSAQPTHSPVRWIAVRQLARGPLPGKRTYTIIGERYWFQRRVYFTLAISIDRPGLPPGGGGGGGFNPSQTPGVLAYTEFVACGSHPYAVIFGLLRAPPDRVVVRRGSARTVLRHIPIPAVLHAHGVLAYARLARAPTEVVVQRPDGTRRLDDKLPGGGCSPGVVIALPAQIRSQPR
jgi:hypothetical protein